MNNIDSTNDNGNRDNSDPADPMSCAANLSRKSFLTLILQRAAAAGVVLVGPKVIDKFLVPPASAMMVSTGSAVPS